MWFDRYLLKKLIDEPLGQNICYSMRLMPETFTSPCGNSVTTFVHPFVHVLNEIMLSFWTQLFFMNFSSKFLFLVKIDRLPFVLASFENPLMPFSAIFF